MSTIPSALSAKIDNQTSSDGPGSRWSIAPGVLLTAAIAVAALVARQLPGASTFSPLILSLVIGTIVHNAIGTPDVMKPGVAFSAKRLLRVAIILLGFQLTVAQLIDVGGSGIVVILVTLCATFLATRWFGRLLGIEPKLVQLIAAGTSICGASAVITTNIVTNASEEDVTYSVACITVFGSLAMLIYPFVSAYLHMSPYSYGLWAGASIHEIAQVAGATFQQGQAAGEVGTVAKLSRVILLGPMVIAIGFFASGQRQKAESGRSSRPPVPWFIMGFILLVLVNSIVSIASEVRDAIAILTTLLFSMALGALGLETDIRKLRSRGLRPLLLGAASWLFIASFSLGLIQILT